MTHTNITPGCDPCEIHGVQCLDCFAEDNLGFARKVAGEPCGELEVSIVGDGEQETAARSALASGHVEAIRSEGHYVVLRAVSPAPSGAGESENAFTERRHPAAGRRFYDSTDPGAGEDR